MSHGPVCPLLAIATLMLVPAACLAGQPHAVMTASPNPADIGQTVFFDGSGSYHDDEGSGHTIVSYEWDLDGDGAYDEGSGVITEYIYTDEGVYFPSLLVTDDLGVTDADTVVLFIQGPVADEQTVWSRIKTIFGL